MRNILLGTALLALVACDPPSSNEKQAAEQETMLAQATDAIGMPAITRFAERRQLKEILELRDRNPPTITYVMDLGGGFHKICDSIGFGLPYSTQYTAPESMQYSSGSGGSYNRLPQADPNGLFSPAAAEGTWIVCTNPTTKEASVTYIEQRVLVSQFPLAGAK